MGVDSDYSQDEWHFLAIYVQTYTRKHQSVELQSLVTRRRKCEKYEQYEQF